MTAHTSAHASDPVAPELVEFRREVDAWINENFPAELRTEEKQEEFYQYLPRYPDGEDFQLWKQRDGK